MVIFSNMGVKNEVLRGALDLIWMYSLSQGKLSIPKLWNAKKASISGAKLIESKKVIEDLYDKMKRRSTTLQRDTFKK